MGKLSRGLLVAFPANPLFKGEGSLGAVKETGGVCSSQGRGGEETASSTSMRRP